MTDSKLSLDDVYALYGEADNVRELFYDWSGANKWLFVQINSIRGDLYDAFMRTVSHLSDFENFPYYFGLIAALVMGNLLLRKLSRKGGNKQYFVRWLGVFAVLIAGFVANVVVIDGAKKYFHYPRPYIALAKDKNYAEQKVFMLEAREGPEDDYRSFPSGHVAFMTMIVVALWPMLSGGMQWLGVGLIALAAWSRVSLGMHFPADALGSVLISFPLIVIVRAVVYGFLRRFLRLNC